MPTVFQRFFGRNAWRAIGAWLLTCYLAAVVVIAGFAFIGAIDAASDPGRQAYWGSVTMAPVWGHSPVVSRLLSRRCRSGAWSVCFAS